MRVYHTVVIKNTFIRATKISRPNRGTQTPYDQSNAAKLCETARNEYKSYAALLLFSRAKCRMGY